MIVWTRACFHSGTDLSSSFWCCASGPTYYRHANSDVLSSMDVLLVLALANTLTHTHTHTPTHLEAALVAAFFCLSCTLFLFLFLFRFHFLGTMMITNPDELLTEPKVLEFFSDFKATNAGHFKKASLSAFYFLFSFFFFSFYQITNRTILFC
jgi:hypothetical protein